MLKTISTILNRNKGNFFKKPSLLVNELVQGIAERNIEENMSKIVFSVERRYTLCILYIHFEKTTQASFGEQDPFSSIHGPDSDSSYHDVILNSLNTL